MWSSSSQSRAKSNAQRQSKKRRLGSHSHHLSRVEAEIKLQQDLHASVSNARVMLNDFTPKGLRLFSQSPFMVGSRVALTLSEPQRIYLNAQIVGCWDLDPESQIISSQRFNFRISLQFIFSSEEERAQIQTYCNRINQDYVFKKDAA